MTEEERQRQNDQFITAQIIRLLEEAPKLQAEREKLNAERAKLEAEREKLVAEHGKLLTDRRWYPFAVAAAMGLSGAALGGFLLTLMAQHLK
jgi:hypothetical protein